MKEIKYKILLLDYKTEKNSIIKDDTDEESDEGKTNNNNTSKHFLCFYFSPHSGVYS